MIYNIIFLFINGRVCYLTLSLLLKLPNKYDRMKLIMSRTENGKDYNQ